MIKRILVISFVLISQNLLAQFFETGTEPFGTKWRQIKTEKFSVIFPKEAEKIAMRYANLLCIIDSVTPKSLLANQRFFDVIVHNHSTLSNGFVAWAPKRMEIISQPPSTTPAQPWLTQLAVHETRHTSQMFRLHSGLKKVLYYFFGEQIIGASAGFVPNWFLEGDAVAFETATSNTGRGRQADFYQYYRAHYLTKPQTFKYDKFLLGSYRDNIPNHYNLGYQMVSYVKVKYGNQVWANSLGYVSKYPFTVFPFYFGLKGQTGLSRNQLFNKTFSNLDSIWSTNQIYKRVEKYQPVNKNNKEYADYRFPHLLADSSMIAYKTSLSTIPRFIKIDEKTKKETTIVTTGFMTSNPTYFSENIFWTEYKPHIRWEYKNYSIVKCYNAQTGEIKTISDNGRYFSPIYNPNDELVYVYSGNDDGSSSIVAFSLSGEKKKSISLPYVYQPFELSYNQELKFLVLGIVTDKGKSMLWLNDDGTTKLIYGPTFRDIHSITPVGNTIFFSTTEGYKEEIFALNIQNNQVYQITNSEFGATDPSYVSNTNQIVFANFKADGYSLSITKVDTSFGKIKLNITIDDDLTTKLRASEKFNIDSVKIPNKEFTITKFKGYNRLINIHSWSPFYYDITKLTAGEVEVKPGVTIFSQSLTGTSTLAAGYGYDSSHLTHINYQYNGFFPVISLDFKVRSYSPAVFYVKNAHLPDVENQSKELQLNVFLPLKLSDSRFTTFLYPMVQLISSNDYLFSTSDSLYHKGLHQVSYRVYLSSTQRLAHKNIRPRLGFELDVNYRHAPFNRNNFGSLKSGQLALFLPGLGLNHSILGRIGLQQQNMKNGYFSNNVIFPRGYINFPSEKFRSLTLEYLMPIAYPDFALGSVVYVKRFSLNAFYDFAKNEFSTQTQIFKYDMRSFGFELFTDLNLFRTRYPIRIKYQQGWTGNSLSPFRSVSFFLDFYGQ